MWKYCGVVRDEKNLLIGLKEIKNLKNKVKDIDVRIGEDDCSDLISLLEFEASLLTAESTIISALYRKESRGSHQRNDYPQLSEDEENVNYSISLKNDELEITKIKNHKLSSELGDIVSKTDSINDISKRLLE